MRNAQTFLSLFNSKKQKKKLLSDNNNSNRRIPPLFTLGSIYSTYASGAQHFSRSKLTWLMTCIKKEYKFLTKLVETLYAKGPFWCFECLYVDSKRQKWSFPHPPLHLITVPLFGQLTVQLWMEKKRRGVDCLVLWSNPFKEWLCLQVKEKIPVFKLLVMEQSNKMKYFHLCLTWVACFNFGEAKIGIVSIYNSSYFIQHFTWKRPTITWVTFISIVKWRLLII